MSMDWVLGVAIEYNYNHWLVLLWVLKYWERHSEFLTNDLLEMRKETLKVLQWVMCSWDRHLEVLTARTIDKVQQH